MDTSLVGKVALVAGATRGAGRGIAVQLGAAGATVYCTGRTTRSARSEMNRPETIEETAALVDAAGGTGHRRPGRPPRPGRGRRPRRPHRRRAGRAARARQQHLGGDDDGVGQDGVGVVARPRAAHVAPGGRHPRHHQPLRPPAADQVRRVASSSRSPTGRPSTTPRTTGSRSSTTWPRRPTCAWRSPWPTSCSRTAPRPWRSRRAGCARRRCSRRTASPRRTGATRRRSRPTSPISESPAFVGRAVAALAADPDVARWNGQSLSSGQLAQVYGFTDVDGSRPDAWRYVTEVQDAGKPADTTGYR